MPKKLKVEPFKKMKKIDNHRLHRSQEKVQEWIKEFMSEVDRVNHFFETKQEELIDEFKSLQAKYLLKIQA